MNFTYLAAGSDDPPQEILEKHDIFIAVIVLSDEMQNFAMEAIGFDLKSANAVCWLVQQKHLRSAAKGSALSRLHEVIKSNSLYSNIEHSFLAFASKSELINREGGSYISLHLHSEHDDSTKIEKLKMAIQAAFKAGKPQKHLLNIDRIISAASLLASILGSVR